MLQPGDAAVVPLVVPPCRQARVRGISFVWQVQTGSAAVVPHDVSPCRRERGRGVNVVSANEFAVGGRVQVFAGACWSYLGRNRQWCCRGASCLVSLERGSFVSANKARCGWASASSCCLLVLPDQVVAAVIKGGHANNLCVVGVLQTRGSMAGVRAAWKLPGVVKVRTSAAA